MEVSSDEEKPGKALMVPTGQGFDFSLSCTPIWPFHGSGKRCDAVEAPAASSGGDAMSVRSSQSVIYTTTQRILSCIHVPSKGYQKLSISHRTCMDLRIARGDA